MISTFSEPHRMFVVITTPKRSTNTLLEVDFSVKITCGRNGGFSWRCLRPSQSKPSNQTCFLISRSPPFPYPNLSVGFSLKSNWENCSSHDLNRSETNQPIIDEESHPFLPCYWFQHGPILIYPLKSWWFINSIYKNYSVNALQTTIKPLFHGLSYFIYNLAKDRRQSRGKQCQNLPAEFLNEILGIPCDFSRKLKCFDSLENDVIRLHWLVRCERRSKWKLSTSSDNPNSTAHLMAQELWFTDQCLSSIQVETHETNAYLINETVWNRVNRVS